MEKITIQFKSAHDLWRYRIAAKINSCEMNPSRRTLTFYSDARQKHEENSCSFRKLQ